MDELTMIRVLLDEAPPSAKVIAEGRRRIAASATEPGRPVALRGVAGAQTRPTTGLRPARGRGFRHRPARRVAVGAAAVTAAAALALVALVPHGAPAARPSHGQAGGLPGRPAREFLLAMAVKAAAGPSTGRYYCWRHDSGGRVLVGPGDTTLQPPWAGGPAAVPGYQYTILTKTMIQVCTEPPRKGWPGGSVKTVTQSLGAQPASPADAAAWRRAGSPASWIAWYDSNARITTAAGPRHVTPGRRLTGTAPHTSPPTNPAQLKAYLLAHNPGEAGSRTDILSNEAIGLMMGPYTPAVRAAAYRVLASLPGIRMKPNVQDPAGQSGTGVFFTGSTAVAIVDPATGALLCMEDVAKRPIPAAHVTAGTMLDYTLFTSSFWTNTRPRS